MFYVYVYKHPETQLPFYVGKGKNDREYHHWWKRNTHPNDNMRTILLEIKASRQQPIILRVFETEDENIAYEKEKELIQQYGRVDLGTGSLCNRTPGGEGFGNTGTKWSDRQRERMRALYLLNTPGVGFDQYDMKGQKLHTYNHARELRDCGFTFSQIMNIRLCCRGERYSCQGFRWSYKTTPLPNATTLMKRVYQFSKKGQLINEFISITEASNHTGVNMGDIASVVRGNTKMKSAGGFVWTDRPDQAIHFNKKYYRAVEQRSLTGEFIDVYPSISHAVKSTGLGLHNISNCCRGKSKTAGGFVWSYLAD